MILNCSNIKEHIDIYISSLKTERNLSDLSIKAYYSDLTDLLARFTESTRSEIDSTFINKYIEWLQNSKKLKDSSIKRKYITLKSFFTYLVSKKLIQA